MSRRRWPCRAGIGPGPRQVLADLRQPLGKLLVVEQYVHLLVQRLFDDEEFAERLAQIGEDLARARTEYLRDRANADELIDPQQ